MEKEIVNKSTHKKNKTLIFLIVILLLAGLGVGIYFLVTNLSKQTCIIRTYYGDVLVETFEVKEGDSFDLNQITYEGYEILGIYDNRDLSGDALTGKIKIKKNINLFLNCERLFNIKLVNDTEIINVYGKDGEVVQNPMIPAKEHAKFLGWGLNGEIILSPTLPYVINTSEFSDYVLTLTAIWEDAFVLSFNMNGGQQIENMYAFSGESLTLPAANRDHYVFIGWKTDDDIILNVGDKIELFSNKILYATWREEQYTISFDTKDNGIIDSIDVHYGEEINLLAVDAVGMVFNGWNFNYQIFSSNNQFIVPDLGNDGEVVCFVANFSPEIYFLNFNSNGGNVINKIKVTYQDEIILPTVSKEGYTFAGWEYNGKTLKDNYIVEDFGENECNVTLNAIWEVEKYVISFDGLGYQEFDDVEMIYGQTWNLPSFPKVEGYDFNGWTLNNSILNGYVPDLGDNGEKFIAVADLTIKSYTFILNLNGGFFDGSTELVKTIQANYGDDISFPVAIKEGYDFLGWECEDKLFSGNYKVEDLDDFITKNPNVISCNALWDPHTITITFDYGEKEIVSGGDVEKISYIVGTDLSNLPTPTYVEPYYFVGWSISSSEYIQPKEITADITLFAIIEQK